MRCLRRRSRNIFDVTETEDGFEVYFGGVFNQETIRVVRGEPMTNWEFETICREFIWWHVANKLSPVPYRIRSVVPPTIKDMWIWIDSIRSIQLPQPFCKKFHYTGAYVVFQIDLPEISLFVHRNGLIMKRIGAVEFPIEPSTLENERVYQELREEYNTKHVRTVQDILSVFLPPDVSWQISQYLRA